jgi:hypothetical protein
MFLPGLLFIAKFFSVAIASWLLIHVLSIFGIFIVFAYPIWWFIFPESTWCLYCRSRKQSHRCPLCNLPPSVDNYHPKNLRSAFLNSSLVFIFTVASFLLVFGEYRFLHYLSIAVNNKTATFNVTDKGKHSVGEVFPMEIQIDNLQVPINTVQVDLSYDSESLEALEVSTEGSFATVFIEKSINNEYGMVRLTGGVPNPGYSGKEAFFGTVFFKGKIPGIFEVEFLPTSVVLANDGKGTNVLRNLISTSFLIVDSPIGEPTSDEERVSVSGNSVLGDRSEEPQLHLYLSDDEVLGTASESQKTREGSSYIDPDTIDEEADTSVLKKILDIIIRIDRAIVNIWMKAFTFISFDFTE